MKKGSLTELLTYVRSWRREPSRIPLLFLRGLNKKSSMLKKFFFKKISTIEIPKSSKLNRYVNKMRKLYQARNRCNNKREYAIPCPTGPGKFHVVVLVFTYYKVKVKHS